MGANTSGQQGSEVRDSIAHKVGETLDCFNQRLTFDNLRLVERYTKCELHLLIRFRVGTVDEEFIAHFQRAFPVGGSKIWQRHVGYFEGRDLSEIVDQSVEDPETAEGGADGQNQAVFVDVVHLVQDPELVACPSLEWCERADRILSLLPHTLYFSLKVSFEYLEAALDGKLDSKGILGLRTNEEQLVSEMVERAPEVLQHIPGDCGQTGRRIVDSGYVINQLASLRVALGTDFIWIGTEKGIAWPAPGSVDTRLS